MGEREAPTNNRPWKLGDLVDVETPPVETDESILPEGITQTNKQAARPEQPIANIREFEFSTNRLPTDPSIAPSQG